MSLLGIQSSTLQFIGGILAAIAALIATYKFILRRPKLYLVPEKKRDFVFDQQVQTNPVFYVINDGLRFAEDVYLEVSLPSWNFGEEQGGAEIEINVQLQSSDAEIPGENSKEVSESASEDETTQGTDKDINSTNSKEEEIGNITLSETGPDIRHQFLNYIGAPGEINQFFIEDTLYSGSRFRLFSTTIKLERFQTYELEYRIGCRTYAPRKGKIEFRVGYDDIEIAHTQPRFWRAWSNNLIGALFQEEYSFSLRDSDVEFYQVGFFETLAVPVATFGIDGNTDKLFTAVAKVTIYLGKKKDENIVGTISHSGFALSTGEKWETRSSWGPSYKSQLVDFNSEYQALRQIPLILSPRAPPYPHDPKNRLQIHWDINYYELNQPRFEGVEIIDSNLLGKSPQKNDHTTVHAEGRLKNDNFRDIGVFVVAKFYAEDNTVLSTPYKYMTVSGNESEKFYIKAGLEPEQQKRVRKFEFVLARSVNPA